MQLCNEGTSKNVRLEAEKELGACTGQLLSLPSTIPVVLCHLASQRIAPTSDLHLVRARFLTCAGSQFNFFLQKASLFRHLVVLKSSRIDWCITNEKREIMMNAVQSRNSEKHPFRSRERTGSLHRSVLRVY